MEAVAGILGVAVLIAAVAAAGCAPLIHRSIRHTQERGRDRVGGLASGLDAVWRPSVDEVLKDVAIQQSVPAPAPSPGDPGRVGGGRIMIDVTPRGISGGADPSRRFRAGSGSPATR